mgnify:CR=1 FL=1
MLATADRLSSVELATNAATQSSQAKAPRISSDWIGSSRVLCGDEEGFGAIEAHDFGVGDERIADEELVDIRPRPSLGLGLIALAHLAPVL